MSLSAPLIRRRQTGWQQPSLSTAADILSRYQTPGTVAITNYSTPGSSPASEAASGGSLIAGQRDPLWMGGFPTGQSNPNASLLQAPTEGAPVQAGAVRGASPQNQPAVPFNAPAENSTQAWQRQAKEKTQGQAARYYERKDNRDSRDPEERRMARRTTPGAPTVNGSSDWRRPKPITFNNSASGWQVY